MNENKGVNPGAREKKNGGNCVFGADMSPASFVDPSLLCWLMLRRLEFRDIKRGIWWCPVCKAWRH